MIAALASGQRDPTIFLYAVMFLIIVAGAAWIGHVGGRIVPTRFKIGGSHSKAISSFGPAVIDDDTPTPEHARFRWSRLARAIGVGAFVGRTDGGADRAVLLVD